MIFVCPSDVDSLLKAQIEFHFNDRMIKQDGASIIKLVNGQYWVLIAENLNNKIVLGTAALQGLDIVFDYNNPATPTISFTNLPAYDKHRISNLIVLCVASAAVLVIIILLIKKCLTKEEED
jgi:hypothetical protein